MAHALTPDSELHEICILPKRIPEKKNRAAAGEIYPSVSVKSWQHALSGDLLQKLARLQTNTAVH